MTALDNNSLDFVTSKSVSLDDAQANPGFSAFSVDKQISFIRPYDPRVSDIPNYRHAIIRFWTPKGQKAAGIAAKPAKMVTIPSVKLPDDDYLMPEQAYKVLTGVLEDQQDIIIKSKIDAGEALINWADVSIPTLFDALTSVRVSKRLTSEQIKSWATTFMTDAFKSRVAEMVTRNPTINAGSQLAKTTNTYVELFSKLSAPVPKLDAVQLNALTSMLDRSKLNDDIAAALRNKINVLLNPEIEGMDNL
jgi:carboxylesterase type B